MAKKGSKKKGSIKLSKKTVSNFSKVITAFAEWKKSEGLCTSYEELIELVKRVHPSGEKMLESPDASLVMVAQYVALQLWIDNSPDTQDTRDLRFQLKQLKIKGQFKFREVSDEVL